MEIKGSKKNKNDEELNEVGLGFCGGHSGGGSLAMENIGSSSKVPIKN